MQIFLLPAIPDAACKDLKSKWGACRNAGAVWGPLAKSAAFLQKPLYVTSPLLSLAGNAPIIASSAEGLYRLSHVNLKVGFTLTFCFPRRRYNTNEAIRSITVPPTRHVSKTFLWPHRSAMKHKINRVLLFHFRQKKQHWPASSAKLTEIYRKNGSAHELLFQILLSLFFVLVLDDSCAAEQNPAVKY